MFYDFPRYRRRRQAAFMKSPARDNRKMTFTGAYLGVSPRKMGRIAKDQGLEVTVDPLDRRRKLLKVIDLDKLKEASLGRSE